MANMILIFEDIYWNINRYLCTKWTAGQVGEPLPSVPFETDGSRGDTASVRVEPLL